MNKNSETKNTEIIWRNSADPFPIYFSRRPYELTEAQLLEQADGNISGQQHWHYLEVDIVSFEGGVLQCRAHQHRLGEFQVAITVEEEKIEVSCNCNDNVERLCAHALKLLQKLSRFNTDFYFETYRPGGLVSTAVKYPELFEVVIQVNGCDVKPKGELGIIYHLSDKIRPRSFAEIFSLSNTSTASDTPLNETPVGHPTIPMAYMVLSPMSRSMNIPPILLSCVGVENKARTALKGFGRFILEEVDFPALTEMDKSLIGLTHRFWSIFNETKGNLYNGWVNVSYDWAKATELFELWKTAVPYLTQQHVYRHPLYRIRYQNKKPSIRSMQAIRIKTERPVLSFRLCSHATYHQLELVASIKDKILPIDAKGVGLFVNDGEEYYLVSSMRDAAILDWMRRMDNRITILREHFEEFDAVYLSLLREYYPVEDV